MISRTALSITSAALLIFNVFIGPAIAQASDKAPQTARKSAKAPSYRLPEGVQPISYKLFFQPDLTEGKFSGSEEIVITVEKPAAELVLNSLEEKISDAYLEDSKSSKTKVEKITADALTEQVHLKLASSLVPGTYTFHCHFDGILNDKLRGFYRSKYKDAGGAEH